MSGYRSRLLVGPRLAETGVEHGAAGAAPRRLAWSRVRAARAAEVGEPQGVRTVVFDLLVDEGGEALALRLDAEPGEPAQRVARQLLRGLGDRALASLKSLAVDGLPARWYPDLRAFEEAAAEELCWGPGGSG